MRLLVFGTGVFLRGFVADFADRAGIPITMVSSTLAGDERAARLEREGGRFTLAVRWQDAQGTIDTQRTVRSIARALCANRDWAATQATARDPSIEVVASNVTESALRLSEDPADDALDRIPPASFPAKLAAWLRERHAAGLPGVLVLPCELIEGNGALLRHLVETVAGRGELGSGFREWLDTRCVFADTLVDRIVTGTPPPAERALWRGRLGGGATDDALELLTVTEPYAVWAIAGGEPVQEALAPLVGAAEGGIVVAEEIAPYVLRKVRILNGLHTAMASVGPPRYGVATVREALAHPELGPFLRAIVEEEILPAICPPLTEAEARAYADQTLRRMENPLLVHRLADIARGARVKWEMRLLPTMEEYERRFGKAPARLSECRRLFLSGAG